MSAAPLKLTAYASGIALPLAGVPDPVFAGRMMGDGLAIDPSSGVLCSPCAGRVAQLHACRHVCLIEADGGVRILLHVGIDTVLLKGEGGTAHVALGEVLSAGLPLIEFDRALIKRHGKAGMALLPIENSDHRLAARSCDGGEPGGEPRDQGGRPPLVARRLSTRRSGRVETDQRAGRVCARQGQLAVARRRDRLSVAISTHQESRMHKPPYLLILHSV